MNSIIDKDTFINSISNNDYSYQKYCFNNYSYKEYFVESSDDADFYGNYLAKLHRVKLFTKCYGCGGRDRVLRRYREYVGKKAGFIVDLDYYPIKDISNYPKLIVTTGYSMENFFFYKENSNYNFELIFNRCFSDKSIRKKRLERFLTLLSEKKNKNLLYYAFFKTCMEFSDRYTHIKSHLRINDVSSNNLDVKKEIEKEISFLDDNIKDRFRSKYAENIEKIRDADYMLIRGHDIFNYLVEYLRDSNVRISEKEIRQMSYEMDIPVHFLEQLERKDI